MENKVSLFKKTDTEKRFNLNKRTVATLMSPENMQRVAAGWIPEMSCDWTTPNSCNTRAECSWNMSCLAPPEPDRNPGEN
jgi:nitrous oxide reductase accessory protein NosL